MITPNESGEGHTFTPQEAYAFFQEVIIKIETKAEVTAMMLGTLKMDVEVLKAALKRANGPAPWSQGEEGNQ